MLASEQTQLAFQRNPWSRLVLKITLDKACSQACAAAQGLKLAQAKEHNNMQVVDECRRQVIVAMELMPKMPTI